MLLFEYIFKVFGVNDPEALLLPTNCIVLSAADSVDAKHLHWGAAHGVPPPLQQVPLELHAQWSIAAAVSLLEQLNVPLTR